MKCISEAHAGREDAPSCDDARWSKGPNPAWLETVRTGEVKCNDVPSSVLYAAYAKKLSYEIPKYEVKELNGWHVIGEGLIALIAVIDA